jgi:Protein of unknown function (DUF3105)
VSSRQQEKEQRRQERLAREQAEAARTKRLRRVQLLLGGLLAAAAIAAVILVAGSGGSSDGSKSPNSGTGKGVPIPKQKLTDLKAAAAAAHCAVHTYPIEGQTHTPAGKETPVKYKTNPPTSGNHNPDPSLDGVYEPGNTPAKEHYVHSLEHGRVEIQYKPGTPARRIKQLETLHAEKVKGLPGYKTLLFQNNTGMKYAVAATSWGHAIVCNDFSDRVFDALRAFRLKYVDTAPESAIPPNNTG